VDGVKVWQNHFREDQRGVFSKPFVLKEFEHEIENFKIAEAYNSSTKQGAVRGMHLQVGESANWRIVSVTRGSIFDVLVDLRPTSKSYKKTLVNNITNDNHLTLLIPPGVAHGFQALSDSDVNYLSTTSWAPKLDTGVNPLSCGIDWPLEVNMLSERDQNLPNLEKWNLKDSIK
jgi:dTDP-4-dehydrorhamnose 3,5-epimerase